MENQHKHYNYPSMASDLEDKEDAHTDFRASYKESMYNVRHAHSHVKLPEKLTISHLPISQTRADHLVEMGV